MKQLESGASTPAGPITTLFFAGQYTEAADQALLRPEAKFETGETPAVIATLAALGQVADAELLLTHQREVLTPRDLAFCLYHLAVAAVTGGRYWVARRHLGRLFGLRNQTSDAETLFFAYQGIAYYRYATGRLINALGCVHRAGVFVRRSGSVYGSFLWQELLGHVQALTGDVEAGVVSLQQATTLAKRLGRNDSVKALDLAALVYLARYRQSPAEATAVLAAKLGDTGPKDMYARASLLLEMARQQVLARHLAPAKASLALATRMVLTLGSRRYEAVLSLRLIDTMILEGAYDAALIVIQTTQRLLNPECDALLEVELVARRRVVLNALGLRAGLDVALHSLIDLERRTGFLRPLDPPLPLVSSLKEPTSVAAAPTPTTSGAKPAPHASAPVRAGASRGPTANGDTAAPLDPKDRLNYRQITFLGELAQGELADVHAYRKRFGISEITACRDLAVLARGGFLKRTGKARATRYHRSDAAL